MNAVEEGLRIQLEAGIAPEQAHSFMLNEYCPQPKQLGFHAAARQADKPDGPTQIAQGGARGGAKSHGMACQIVFDDCQRVPGLKTLYLRSVGASARESFEDLLQKAMPKTMKYYVASRSALELPNGSRVLLGGFRNERDIDKYIGIEYDSIAIDDAHLVSSAKYDLVRGSLRTSKPNWRPRTYLTFNPGGIGHAHLKKKFITPWRNKAQKDSRFFFSLPEDNKFLNKEYIEYLESLSGWLYKAWRQGDFDIAAGQFFTTWRHDIHVLERVDFSLDWHFWLSMDYGFTHFNVIHLHAEDGDGTIYTLAELAERKWLVPRHSAALDSMLNRLNITRHRIYEFVAGGDVFAKRGTTEETIADQWRALGWTLRTAKMDRMAGAAEMLRRLGDVDAGIPPSWFVHQRCVRLIESMPALEHDPHRPEDVLKVDTDDDGSGGDDAYDCARYGLMQRAKATFMVSPMEY